MLAMTLDIFEVHPVVTLQPSCFDFSTVETVWGMFVWKERTGHAVPSNIFGMNVNRDCEALTFELITVSL